MVTAALWGNRPPANTPSTAGAAAEMGKEDIPMRVSVEICVVPMGVEASVSRYVAACVRELEKAGLSPDMTAYGTNVEGEWDEVFAAVRRCHEVVHEMGAPRIFTTLKVGTRTDKEQNLADKVASANRHLSAD